MKRILVIGDIILDVFHHGKYVGQSLNDEKTPVGSAQSSAYMWGGAGFLVRNILALGGSVSFISLLGKDDFTARANEFSHSHLKKIFLQIPSRSTIVKERFWIGKRKLLEWHHEDNDPLRPSEEAKVLRMVRLNIGSADKVVIADYRHGLFSPSLAKKILHECARAGKPLYIDSQIQWNKGNHHWYAGADLFCLNQPEAKSVYPAFNVKNLRSSLERIQKILHARSVVVKLSARGSASISGRNFSETKAHRVKPADTTGAGDAFLAGLAVGGSPLSPEDFRRASIWAALITTMIGTAIPPIAIYKKLISIKK